MTEWNKIKLISYAEGTTLDDYGDPVQIKTETEVYARCKSISQKEFYQAQTAGLKPELKFVLTTSRDYAGQKQIAFSGVVYNVLKTYINERDEIEITVDGGVRDNANA